MQASRGKLTISTQYRTSGTETQTDEDQQLDVYVYPKDVALASVSATGSQTINQGNYNSMRISVSVQLPCAVEEIDAAFKRAFEIVDQQMNQRLK